MKAVVLLLALAAGILIALRLHQTAPAKPTGAAAVDGKDAPELRPNDTGAAAAAVATGAGAKKIKPAALSAEKRRELVQLAAAGTRIRAAGTAGAASAAGGSAEAGDSGDDLTPEQHKEQARIIFDQAQDFFMAKQYLEAADAFLESYGEFPAPSFLFNAAVSYARAHLCDDAVSLFARYQAEDPNHERHQEADTRSLASSLEKCEAFAATPDAP